MMTAQQIQIQIRGDSGELAPMAGVSCSLTRREAAVDRVSATTGRRSQFYRNIAIHEAGHAVVSRLLGLPVAGCTINYINGRHGLVWSDAADDLQPGAATVYDLVGALTPLMSSTGPRDDIAVELQRAGDQVISLLAGVEAEKLFTTAPLPGTGHDLEEAKAIAGLVCRSPRSVGAFLAYARSEAIALIADHRDVALEVVDALLERSTLTGAEIDRILAAG